MNYKDAKETTQRLIDDEYGLAQIFDLALGTDFNKGAFEQQLEAYVAEFGADEQSIRLVIEGMAEAARNVCRKYEKNEEASNAGMAP